LTNWTNPGEFWVKAVLDTTLTVPGEIGALESERGTEIARTGTFDELMLRGKAPSVHSIPFQL
jgi:hypothetical protein